MSYDLFGRLLVETFGAYCVACEAPLASGVQVEHRIAKGGQAGNVDAEMYDYYDIQYLVACGPCNVAKSTRVSQVEQLGDYLWPDAQNTLTAFRFHPDGQVGVYRSFDEFEGDVLGKATTAMIADDLRETFASDRFVARAEKTIALWGFNREQSREYSDKIAADLRLVHRESAFTAAVAIADSQPEIDDDHLPPAVAAAIIGTGYWTLWLHVFLRETRLDLAEAMFTDPLLKQAFPHLADCVQLHDQVLHLDAHAQPQAYSMHNRGDSLEFVECLGAESGSPKRRQYDGEPVALKAERAKRQRGADADEERAAKRTRRDDPVDAMQGVVVTSSPATQPAALANGRRVVKVPAGRRKH